MNIFKSLFASVLVFGSVSLTLAQDTVVTKNADGTYTVIEYPVGKEVSVNLLPAGTFTGKGMARVTRSANGTKVIFDVNGLPATSTGYYAYAVDPTGTPTLLGPLTSTDGMAKAEFTTPMDKFMLVLSPNEGLTGINASNVYLTSEVPTGYTVYPRGTTITTTTTTATGVAASTFTKYEVPLLNVSSFGKDSKTANLHFDSGDLKGLDAKAHIHRHDNSTTVRVEFDDLKKVSASKRFVLWANSPDGQYTRLGQIYNYKNRDEATINAETSLTDFGLLMTVEDTDVTIPTSTVWSVFKIVP
ncbi:MAG TPA: hypothetical protein VGO43_07190 [Pyrinomonadaceae bacterium]|jgi:hypothetical protein|nr:hypothetical protein [Pyrinomonadaceae bacterium]